MFNPRILTDKASIAVLSALRNRYFIWNIFGNIGPLVFALVAMPYIYRQASKDYVGFLTITWAAIGYTGLFDFGISRALFYFAAINKSDHDTDLAGAIGKSALFATGISVVIDITLYALKGPIVSALKMTDHDQVNAIFVIALSLPIYLISNMIRSSLEGLELFKDANVFKFVAYASLFVCPALLIAGHDRSLVHICLLYAAVRAIGCGYALARLSPHLAARRTGARIPIPLRRILGFGGWATVSSTISPLMVYGDRFAIAYANGASALAIYAILQEFIGKTILLSASYVTSIQPRLGYLPAAEAAGLYRREHGNIAILSALVYTGCLLVSPFFVAAWLDVAIGRVAFLAVVMSIGFMFNSMAQAPLAYLLARGHPRRIAFSHMMEALFYFPLLIGAVLRDGVVGAALVGVLRQIFDYGILSWQARRPTG